LVDAFSTEAVSTEAEGVETGAGVETETSVVLVALLELVFAILYYI
jgi:hypothetical protein